MFTMKCISLMLCLACAVRGFSIRDSSFIDFGDAFASGSFEKGCGGKNADIAFIVDNSRSIWIYDFIRMKEFIRDFIHGFEISPSRVRVAALTFGDAVYADETFGFSRYQTEQEVQQGIMDIPYLAGRRTRTDLALKEFRTVVLPEARPDVPKIGIVLTDGDSTFPDQTAMEAELLRDEDIVMFAIGVGSGVSQRELENIASRPEYVFRVTSFAALDEIKTYLGVQICTVPTTPEPTTTPLPKDEPCGIDDPADIMFAFDSLDIGVGRELEVVQRAIEVFSTQESIMHEDMRVGLETSDCPEVQGFALDEYSYDKKLIMDVFGKSMKHMRTDVSSLFYRLGTESFTVANGGRTGVRRVAIVFLRHQPSNPDSILREAALLKEAGVELFVIGVGNEIEDGLLQSLASSPPSIHVLRSDDPNRIIRLGQAIAERICEVD